MDIKKLNEEIEKINEANQLDDLWDEEGATLRDYVTARLEHIMEDVIEFAKQYPAIIDDDAFYDFENQINALNQDLNLNMDTEIRKYV